MFGYHGKLLRVDLTGRSVAAEALDESVLRMNIGGVGMAASILNAEVAPGVDPLAPENVFVAFTGPFTGTRVPSSSRHHLAAKSPQTGIFGESNVGGSWAVHLKGAGYDGLVVSGRADHPVYLWINEDGVTIRDARPIWGQDTYASAAWLKAQTDPKATVAVIGQAGERLARIAGIPHIGSIVRAAARTGLGAVWGSKNLKAVVVSGARTPRLADPEALEQAVKVILPQIRKATETFGKFGTSGGLENYAKLGNFPTQNWQVSGWKAASRITGSTMHATVLSGRKACLMCPIACGRHVKLTEGAHAPLDAAGPEYESLGTLGGLCRVDDLPAICAANDLCNRYGLDTISTGATIAFAMEAYEKGLISREDADGVELTWGNAQALVEMVGKIGRREGIGRLMGEGSKRMAETLGGGAAEFAVHVKGLEPSAHDPRRFFSQALNYATAARGACHNASWSHPYELALSAPEIGISQPQESYQLEGKAEFTAKLQNWMCAMDCLVICRFTQVGKAVTLSDQLDWIRAVTGWDMDVAEYMQAGERAFTRKRLFNARLGVSRKDDILPPRFLTLLPQGEGLTNQHPPIGRLLADYYQYRGWDEMGTPTGAKVDELGLGDFLK